MPFCRPWSWKTPPDTRVISLCIIVWCSDTQSTKACSGYTATRFLRNHFTAVTDWTSSWFGRRESTMALLLSRLILSGTLGCCFCSQPLQQPTRDPSPSIALLCRLWKHMTILKMVIICIICIMCIMSIIVIMFNYCRMVKIDWISGCIRAGPQKACSLCHPHSEYPGKTSCCASRWHGNNSAPPSQSLLGRTRRPQEGCWWWMQDVVCQRVGIVVVPWYVMNRMLGSAGILHLIPPWGSAWSTMYYAYYGYYTC